MIKNLFKKKLKCPICNEKAEDLSAEMRLDTSEGVHIINICPDCADFFDLRFDSLASSTLSAVAVAAAC